MTELEMFVGMLDRANERISIEEKGKETHVVLIGTGSEFVFGEFGQLVEIW